MKNILAIDIGRHCGWALHDGVVQFGVMHFCNDASFHNDFYKFIRTKIAVYSIDVIAYEHASFQPGHAGQQWGQLHGCLLAATESQDCVSKIVPVHAGTWKKHICGNDKAPKPKSKKDIQSYEVIQALTKRGFGPFATTDAADALGVLLWYIETQKG